MDTATSNAYIVSHTSVSIKRPAYTFSAFPGTGIRRDLLWEYAINMAFGFIGKQMMQCAYFGHHRRVRAADGTWPTHIPSSLYGPDVGADRLYASASPSTLVCSLVCWYASIRCYNVCECVCIAIIIIRAVESGRVSAMGTTTTANDRRSPTAAEVIQYGCISNCVSVLRACAHYLYLL